jgi:hypothetical protein
MPARCSCREKWIKAVAGNNSQRELTFHARDLNGIGYSARLEEWKNGDWKGGRMEDWGSEFEVPGSKFVVGLAIEAVSPNLARRSFLRLASAAAFSFGFLTDLKPQRAMLLQNRKMFFPPGKLTRTDS